MMSDDMTPAFSGELMLAGWKESHNNGAVVSFMLSDRADLDLFRTMTVRKANLAGQRFCAVLVEIGDDEKPVVQPMSQQAALLCKSMGFKQFVETRSGYAFDTEPEREDMAANFLRNFTGVKSRSEIDANGRAALRFQQLKLEYRTWASPS